MKTKKLLISTFLIVTIGSMININASPVWDYYFDIMYGVKIDPQGRRVDNHEDNGYLNHGLKNLVILKKDM